MSRDPVISVSDGFKVAGSDIVAVTPHAEIFNFLLDPTAEIYGTVSGASIGLIDVLADASNKPPQMHTNCGQKRKEPCDERSCSNG